MVKKSILIHPDPRLKRICTPIADTFADVKNLAEDLLETMYDAPGIGLAAPQIGILKRIFVMDCSYKEAEPDPMIFVNPEIIWASTDCRKYEEGCLSIPDIFVELERPYSVTVQHYDLEGKIRKITLEGLESICAQHEIDHLNGKLFIDYLGPIKRGLITKKMKKLKRELNRN